MRESLQTLGRSFICVIPILLISCPVFAAADSAAPAADATETNVANKLSTYLSDDSVGAISAASIAGVSGSAIQDLKTEQGLMAAINSVATGANKAGVAFSITPARTSLVSASGHDYAQGGLALRLADSLTVSYAENSASLSSVDYRKTAFSVSTSAYLNSEDDPVIIGYRGWTECRQEADTLYQDLLKAQEDEADAKKNGNEQAKSDAKDKVKKLRDAVDGKLSPCILGKIKAGAKWNASRLTVSAGAGWIEPQSSSGPKLGLGRSYALSLLYGAGPNAFSLTVDRYTAELDLTTIAKTPAYKDNTIVAARFTNNSGDAQDLYWLAEVSNAKSDGATASNQVFKYALGVDKKISKGIWIQFRLGRNSTSDGTKEQTSSLLNLTWASTPDSSLFSR